MLVRFTRVHARLLPRVNPRYAQFCYYTYLESFTNIHARLLPRVNPSRSFIPTFLPLSEYLFHQVTDLGHRFGCQDNKKIVRGNKLRIIQDTFEGPGLTACHWRRLGMTRASYRKD